MAKGLPKSLSRAAKGGTFPAATTTQRGTVRQAANQQAAAAADTAALKTQFDALLTKLKAAGLMAADPG